MSWTQPGFEVVARLLGTRTGLVFTPDRRASAEMGIRRAMARVRITDPARYADRLAQDPALFDDLVGELTIGETYFFREPAQFQFIRAVILPELRRLRGPEHPVRAWSAGCASGEEAYSLAMLFADEGLADQYHLLGTDISREALTRAREGSYTTWSLRGEGASLARPHLRRSGDRSVVEEAVRRRVAFESLNLALDVYPSYATGTWALDLILCRNVLIYFDRETVRAVAGRLYESLAEGGWLITASSDPPLGAEAPFETVVTDHGLFYRRPALILNPPPQRQLNDHFFSLPLGEGNRRRSPGEEPSPRTFDRAGAGPPPPVHKLQPSELIAAALDDLGQGHYARAAERTRDLTDDAEASAVHVRALANLDLVQAERSCAKAAARHPLSGELHYLRAVLLLGLDREREAAGSARRAIYLDRTLAIAHFLLGSILRRRGDRAGAWRAYRNARDLCAARAPDEVVPLSDGEPAGRLAELSRLQMAQLERRWEDRP